eukprot:TRINITY_DN954_c0_g1_i2.p1 TRINITY_DN954_c0_g1~~TRINITY_DN954_c0_g1_i2.p1  ORF type:complete len:343 (+),score=61.36 TRINITY_DN954_c0_g1_i2:68-1030(+)
MSSIDCASCTKTTENTLLTEDNCNCAVFDNILDLLNDSITEDKQRSVSKLTVETLESFNSTKSGKSSKSSASRPHGHRRDRSVDSTFSAMSIESAGSAMSNCSDEEISHGSSKNIFFSTQKTVELKSIPEDETAGSYMQQESKKTEAMQTESIKQSENKGDAKGNFKEGLRERLFLKKEAKSEKKTELTEEMIELGLLFDLEAQTCASLGVDSYLQRIRKYADISDTCYIVAMLYLGRLQSTGVLEIKQTNVHKLLLTSVMIAVKYCEDQRYSNKMFSAIGGITLKQVNKLEFAFLQLINFKLDVTDEELAFALQELIVE